MKVKRWLAVVISVMMILGLMPSMAFAEEETAYKDGSYTGTGTGHNGEVTLKVTVSEGKISAIEEVRQNETASYWAKAKALFDVIIEQQSAEVDTISGATRSSNAIKGAVSSALLQAVDSGPFDSGSGTEKNPYVIKTADQLKAFASSVDGGLSYAGKYIVLGADIDISGSNWNPIGTEASAKEDTATVFNGTFDGQGCTISGLTIKAEDYTAETNAGLFSSLNNSARVENLNLTDVNIDISSADAVLRAGGIAGDTVSGTNSDSGIGTIIDGCSVQGSIKVATNGAKLIFGGGIVGRGNIITAIINCWTDVQVEAASKGGSQSAYAGGILGTSGNNAKIINCITFGDQKAISPKSTNFGGMAGGIAAMYSGKAWNIGAAGNSIIGNGGSSHKWVGSLFGEITTSGMTKEGGSYVYPAAGNLRDYGYYDDEITLTIQKYVSATGVYDSSSKTNLVPTGIGSITNDTVFANSDNVKVIANMGSEEYVAVMNGNLKAVTALMDAYGIQGVQLRQWQLREGKALPTGEPWVNTEPNGSIFDSGAGSAEDPYIIKTKAQMQAFAGSLTEGIDYHGYHVALGDNIDISGENWTPVGGSDYAFDGTFDGCGYTISGMTQGEADAPRVIDNRVSPYMGLFGVLEKNATVKNLNLTNVAVYLKADKSFYSGGLAGMAVGKAAENGSTGALIDNVSIAGVLQGTTGSGNVLVGGIVGYQYRSNVINSRTDVDVYAEVLAGSAVAEAGGITALNNRGLIANCYTLGDESGKVSREDGAEGAPAIGGIAAVNGGWISNCYSKGNTEGTGLGAVYNGAVTGWITGTGSTYACWFNKDATMKADGKVLPEAVAVGTKVPAGVNDEGDAYTGGLADDLNGYALSEYPIIWEEMNKRFDAFPVDLTRFGLATNALKTWIYDSDQNVVTWGDEYRKTVYKQPEVEIVPKPVLVPGDGVWYGRNADKTTVVKVTVEGNAVTKTEVISGETGGEAYEEACKKAVEKATYGDTTDYSAPDAGRFAGGKGTEASPYLIRTEAQLRYLAQALNEDNAWEDVYFKQIADIDVSSAQWLPIG